MKKISVLLATLFVLAFALALAQPTQASPDNPTSMNARMTHWQEESAVIHILVWSDAGRVGPAEVEVGQPLLFGFEWSGGTVESLQADYIDNPNHDFTVSVDGDPARSVKSFYQTPFNTATKSGPAWNWDHDADGPGDGDGDGVGDWSGAVLFFRYPYPGLALGVHTFVFTVVDTGQSDIITVDVVP